MSSQQVRDMIFQTSTGKRLKLVVRDAVMLIELVKVICCFIYISVCKHNIMLTVIAGMKWWNGSCRQCYNMMYRLSLSGGIPLTWGYITPCRHLSFMLCCYRGNYNIMQKSLNNSIFDMIHEVWTPCKHLPLSLCSYNTGTIICNNVGH